MYLCSPVTEVVERVDVPTACLVQVGEERADDRTSQVADMERLGDVGRGVFDDDPLALAEVVGAVLRLF